MDVDLRFYPTTDDGRPLCPTCGVAQDSAEVTGQAEIGYGNQRGVTGQTYLFHPCGHSGTWDLPMGGH